MHVCMHACNTYKMCSNRKHNSRRCSPKGGKRKAKITSRLRLQFHLPLSLSPPPTPMQADDWLSSSLCTTILQAATSALFFFYLATRTVFFVFRSGLHSLLYYIHNNTGSSGRLDGCIVVDGFSPLL